MMKFKVIVITYLLTTFLSLMNFSAAYVEAFSCTEVEVGISDYMVQAIINDTHFRSEKNLWSWAASVRSVLSTYGVNTTQTDIVTRVMGSPENREATAEQVRLALEGYQVFVDGQGKKTVSNFITIEEVMPVLEQGFPVLMGWQGKVYALTQINYIESSSSSSSCYSFENSNQFWAAQQVVDLTQPTKAQTGIRTIKELTFLDPWTDDEAIRTISFSEIKEDNPIFIGVELEDSPIPPSSLSVIGLDDDAIQRIIADAGFRQEKSFWPWAASAKSILSVYGINLTQSEIATRILGSPTNAGVTADQLRQTLDGHQILTNEQYQRTNGKFLGLSEGIRILEQGLPIMVGFSGHVYTIVKLEYYKSNPLYGISVKELTLLDPWPDNQAIQNWPLSTINSSDPVFIGIDLEYSPQLSNSPIQPSSLQFIQPSNDSSVHTNRLSISLALQGQVSDLLFSIDNQSIASNYSAADYRDIGVIHATGAARQVNLELDLPANLRQGQEFRLSVVASGAAGLSQPVHLDLRYQGPEQAKRELFFVAAGLNSYEDSDIRPLRFAAVDALELAAVFVEQAPQLYDDFYIKVLFTDDNPQHLLQRYLPIAHNNNLGRGDFGERLQVFYNRESTDGRMRGIIDDIFRQAGSEDTIVITISGHGVNNGGKYYIPFYATNLQDSLAVSSLQSRDLLEPLAATQAQVVIILDTCYSGASLSGFFRAPSEAQLSSPVAFAQQLRDINAAATGGDGNTAEKNVLIVTSTSPNELAVEEEYWGNGALVETMLEYLRYGGTSGGVSILEMMPYVSKGVTELTHGQQTPKMFFNGSDFILLRPR